MMKSLLSKILVAALVPALVFLYSCDSLESNRSPLAPYNPSPEDGATVAASEVQLGWQCSDPEGDQISYTVHFGDSAGLSTSVLITSLTDTFVSVDQLEHGQTYYWSVIAVDDHNRVAVGPVWHFSVDTTAAASSWNPSPPDLSSDLGMSTSFGWDFPFDSAEGVTFDLYCGPTANPPLIAESLSASSYDPGWVIQLDAVQTLMAIYQGESQFYEDSGRYWGQGITADGSAASADILWPIGVYIDSNSIYSYTITTSYQNYLLVTANTVNFDLTDPTSDTWTVNQDGQIICTSNDAEVEFVPSGNYYWKVIARDSLGQSYESPVWSFSSGQYDQGLGTGDN